MEISERTLVTIIEKASKINSEHKNQIYHALSDILKKEEDNNLKINEIILLLENELEARVSGIAAGLTNPRSAIPKKAVFRRVDDTSESNDPVQMETGIGLSSGIIILKK